MTDQALFWLITSMAALAGLAVAARTALAGWRGWLDLRRTEIEAQRGSPVLTSGARIEMADLKERLRKLEAIAAGVDL